ncbi:DNA or RNA helicase of superfamily II, partial [Pseudomonas fluvialis]
MSQAEQRCPACGKANQCAQAGKSQPVTDCWCFHQRLSEQALA